MEKASMRSILLFAFLLIIATGVEVRGSKIGPGHCKTSADCASSCQLGIPGCFAGTCVCTHNLAAKRPVCKTLNDCAKLISDDPLCKASECTADGTCIFVCQ